jgi:hypothetical protein
MKNFGGMSRGVAILLAAAMAVAAGCGSSDNPIDPELLGGGSPYRNHRGGMYNGPANFAALMNAYPKGQPERTPWAGYWWAYTGNGIANSKFGGCSPAGKYDAARGGKGSQSWEVKNHGSQVPKVQGWWGHCNGWCAAAALYPEPRESQRVNGIDFGVADLKALLSEAGMEASADFYGNRIESWESTDSPKFEDTVPNQYFLVLTNYMGKLRMPVLIDRFTGGEVWNQPMVGYEFDYPKPEDVVPPDPANPGVYRINVTSRMWWAEDGVPPDALTPPFEWETNMYFSVRTLHMELWLDGPVVFGPDGRMTSSGNLIVTRQGDNIVGGAWKNGYAYSDGHPDYMWIPYSFIRQDETDHGQEQYANPYVDINWIENHLLNGVDDSTARPTSCSPAPSPRPRPSDGSDPTPIPTSTSNPVPIPIPTSTSNPVPIPIPTPTSR